VTSAIPDRLAIALGDRYRVERELGAGGMATVYLAHDLKHDRDVAVKVLRAELAESLGRQRFVREIRLAARLNHPHILPLYDSGECDGFLYFVMPVMQGQTLRDRLQQQSTLPVDDVVRIATEVADALDYAHRHDVVHRDIKPETRRFVYSPPAVTETRADVSAEISDLVARLLEKAPADRYATGADVVSTLRTSMTGSGPRATVPRPDRAPTEKSIAVLPFMNMSADADNEFFSDGLTEEIITDLSGVKALRVISRNSSMQRKGSTKPLPDIGRELGVRYLLTGSVRKAGNALRITTQLVDAATDTPLWAEKYSGTMDDVFDVQERVSRAIVAALQVQLSASEDVRLAARPIQNPRAFELYLQARDELRRTGTSPNRAKTLIQHAIEIEGESPPLRALRAFMWFSAVRAGLNTDLEPLDATEAEARALVELVPDAPYGHALLGFVGYERGQHREAARHLTRALELDPADADVLFYLAISLQAAGQIEPAVELAVRFHATDPLSPFAWVILGVVEWFAGRAGARVDAIERAVAMDPENPIIHWALGYTYALMGRMSDAAVHAQWMLARVPQLPYTVQLSSLVDATQGRAAAAREALARVDVTPLDAHHTFHLSESFAMAGDTTGALALLERAVDRGFYPYKFFAEYCPFMAPLRGMPEFERIVAKAARRVAEFRA
jgi:TolB-like protein/Flp pilus assembly protein TadD